MITVTLLLAGSVGSASGQSEDAVGLLERIRELTEGSTGRYLTPIPDSRSIVVAIDTSTPLFFYLERGSIRGSAIDDFYTAMDTGDMDAAYDAFIRNAIMTVRVTDYGWNGLGVSMTTESGTEVRDIFFRDAAGIFARVPEPTSMDVDSYTELLRTVVAALESR